MGLERMRVMRTALMAALAAVLGVLWAVGPPRSSSSHVLRSSRAERPAAGHQTRPAGEVSRRRQVRRIRRVHLSASTTVLAYPPPPIQARAAFLVDLTTGRVLYARNADARLPMASTTKITTAALTLAHARLGDMVRVSQNAATIGQSTMELRRGERLSVRDLLYGLLLNSGNDAAVALAEHVGGSVPRFVGMMNALAHALGMKNTHYATPHGLDAPHHYTSARDLATIAEYAMRDRTFRQIVSTENYHIPRTRHNQEHYLGNINRVMYWFPGVDGVKPGDTDAAGLCQVVSDWRGGHHLLAVLLNTPTLWIDIRNLLNYGGRDFTWVQAPVWSDAPTDAISGGSRTHAWSYYFGAGHYIRGVFLHYFRTHGGLQRLGYPRTEAMQVDGETVQYFQGGELIADSAHHSAYPAALGSLEARRLAPKSLWPSARVTPGFVGAYRLFGGRGVLGRPVSGTAGIRGTTVQFFQYGAIAQVGGAPVLLPLGDMALRQHHWFPAAGAANSYPSTLAAETGLRW